VDYATFEKVVDFHIRHGTSVLGLLLHAAESLNLTVEERKQLVDVAVKVAKGRVPLLVHVSLSGTDQVIDLARHAEEAGADAVICTAPYYWPSSEDAQFEHFAALGSAIGISLVAYNSPRAQGGTNLSPRLLVRLIERLDNFVGLKDASFNFDYFIEARRATHAVRPDFGIFTGVEYLLPSLVLGGIGSMSVTNGVAPKAVQDLYTACAGGQYDRARALQEKISQHLRLLMVEYPATIKAGMEIMGRPVGKVRLPIRSLSEEAKRRLRDELGKLGILDQEPHGW